MDITPALSTGTNFIKGYGSSGIRINNLLIKHDLILSANILELWSNSAGLFAYDSYIKFFDILRNSIIGSDSHIVVIIGTGDINQTPDAVFFEFFAKLRIVPEIMTTPAAARTFNVLVSEGRAVYALLKIT